MHKIDNKYDFELDKIISRINKEKAGFICLQFPEGLKPQAVKIANKIEMETKAKCIIWIGSCFGSCDIPPVKKLGIDLLIQFGHSAWPY